MLKQYVSAKYRRWSLALMLSNYWSRRRYISKFFKSPAEKIKYWFSLMAAIAGIVALFADFSSWINMLGGVFTLGGIFYLFKDFKDWTKANIGGPRADKSFEIANDPIRIRDSSDTGKSSQIGKLVRFDRFPKDGAVEDGYVYLTVDSGVKLNRFAYNTLLEAKLSQNDRIEFSSETPLCLKNVEADIIHRNKEIIPQLRLALEVDSKQHSSAKKNFFNSKKVRLDSLKLTETKCEATCQETSYFTSAITNDLFGKILRETRNSPNSPQVFDFRERYPAHLVAADSSLHYWKISSLERSQHVSNHVGCVVLAVTRDNFPILCKQGGESRMYANRLVASGSGSLELSDYNFVRSQLGNSASFDAFLKFGMARELMEETGQIPQNNLKPQHFEKILQYSPKVVIVSYYRDLARSGLPIFVGLAKLDVDFDYLKKKLSTVETLIQDTSRTQINDAQSMIEFLESYTHIDGEIKLKFSDQLLLYRQLLARPLVARAFNTALRN